MAFNGIVGASNIGSFVLQALSFGQCTMNRYNKIQTPLLDASQNLMKAMDEIRQYSGYLNNDEFESTMRQCENLMKSVSHDLKRDVARKSFLVKVKQYRTNKESAQKSLISSIDIQTVVQRVSTRAKKRAEEEQKKVDEATNNERLKRINGIGLKLTEVAAATLADGLNQAVAPLANPSPSRLGNEPDSPFRDPSAGNLNLPTGGDAGDLSLQRLTD
ncbi:hypothetical protein C0995_013875 [Termitomyces sp. Mi166|nr:hypothetical protein C0995_013875 [Termitomyces sp. Mi166\